MKKKKHKGRKKFKSLAVVEPLNPKPFAPLIEQCEDLLRMAKSGELRTLCIVAVVSRGGRTLTLDSLLAAKNFDVAAFNLALDQRKHSLIKAYIGA